MIIAEGLCYHNNIEESSGGGESRNGGVGRGGGTPYTKKFIPLKIIIS